MPSNEIVCAETSDITMMSDVKSMYSILVEVRRRSPLVSCPNTYARHLSIHPQEASLAEAATALRVGSNVCGTRIVDLLAMDGRQASSGVP